MYCSEYKNEDWPRPEPEEKSWSIASGSDRFWIRPETRHFQVIRVFGCNALKFL